MSRKPDRKALGRGLSALLGDTAAEQAIASSAGTVVPDTQNATREIPVDLIHANPNQPRQVFSDAEIVELSDSIKQHGVLQPVLLRPHPSRADAYQIVAGERRWRAAQRAGVHALPAVIRDVNDQQILELAIIENVQRVDLDSIEEALGYQSLIDSYGYTQEQLSRIIGKSRSHLANTLRLMNLPDAVIEMVQAGTLSAGHARALINAPDPTALARIVVARGLSVRQTEALARGGARPRPPRQAPEKDADTRMIEGDLSAAIGMKVSIAHGKSGGSGELKISYKSLDELDRLCQKLAE